MANTTNLYGYKLEVGQAQKEATINGLFDLLDSSVAGRLAISTTGGTTTLTGTPAAPQAQNLFLDVSGTLTSNATIEIPIAAGTGRNRLYVVKNGTTGAYTLTVKKVGGTGVTVTQGFTAILLYNDTDIVKINNEVASASQAWATWTPSWTNLSVGDGTVTAKYTQIGKTVFARVKLVFGSTTSVSGLITVSLPVTSVDYVSYMQLGLASLRDDSGDTYLGDATFASTTTVYILAKNVSGSYIRTASTSSTVPFTWTTSDSIHIQLCYEAA